MYTQPRQLDLFGPDRLARKPFCSYTKDHSYIRPLAAALRRPYIQPNSPLHFYRIVLDLDYHQHATTNVFGDAVPIRDIRLIHSAGAWTKELGIPAPSWVALSPGKNSAHVGFELATPVARHQHARRKPLEFLAAVERGLMHQMHADEGYTGQLCKNPLSESWELLIGQTEPFDLSDFGHFFKFPKKPKYNRQPRGEVGRAVYLFDELRFWAYENIDRYRGAGTSDAWGNAVLNQAEDINSRRYLHLGLDASRDCGLLPFSEVRSAARSVSSWTWANYGNAEVSQAFRELQALRGTLGAAASAKVKRARREEQIIDAIRGITASGRLATMNNVAPLVGCSQSALSQSYRHLFYGNPQ